MNQAWIRKYIRRLKNQIKEEKKELDLLVKDYTRYITMFRPRIIKIEQQNIDKY